MGFLPKRKEVINIVVNTSSGGLHPRAKFSQKIAQYAAETWASYETVKVTLTNEGAAVSGSLSNDEAKLTLNHINFKLTQETIQSK